MVQHKRLLCWFGFCPFIIYFSIIELPSVRKMHLCLSQSKCLLVLENFAAVAGAQFQKLSYKRNNLKTITSVAIWIQSQSCSEFFGLACFINKYLATGRRWIFREHCWTSQRRICGKSSGSYANIRILILRLLSWERLYLGSSGRIKYKWLFEEGGN